MRGPARLTFLECGDVADEMGEVPRVTTCTTPHGSRINPQRTKQYSGCMVAGLLVEIDTYDFGVAR